MKLTRRQRGAICAAVKRQHWPYHCEHGHGNCSNVNAGACAKECAALNARPGSAR
jgi:hypothetical protein